MTQHTVFGFFYDNWQVFAEVVEAENGQRAAVTALQQLENRDSTGCADPRVLAVVAGGPDGTYLPEYVISLEDVDDEA